MEHLGCLEGFGLQVLKGTVKEKWKGGLGWNLSMSGVGSKPTKVLSDVPVSRNL